MKFKTKFKVFLTIVILLGVTYPTLYMFSSEEVTVTVTDKERITTGSGEDLESKFLVYSEGEVFENSDTWLFFKFNSADVQGELKEEGTYTVKVAGWRVPFLSWYRNVIRVTQTHETEEES